VLGAEQNLPGTPKGNQLVAHELTHVIQQESLGERNPTGIGPARDDHEMEAWSVAARIGTNAAIDFPPIGKRATDPLVQRALPAAVVAAGEVLEVALTAAIVLQEQHVISQGALTVVSGAASRRGEPPQPKDTENTAQIFRASASPLLSPDIWADFYIHWQGNDFGEIGAAYVDVAPNHPKFSYSSLSAEFKPLDNLPSKGDDIRAWPMQWIYSGSFDPVGAGDFAFQGKFEINAFGGFRLLDHTVIDNSIGWGGAPADQIVKRGPDIAAPVRPLPPGAKVTNQTAPEKKK
jgi:hypothetical protein